MSFTRVAAVVSAYCPGESVVRTVAAVAPQVASVVVVDDGSPQDATDVLEQCRDLGAEVIRSDANRGIAHALNTGIRAALDAGADAVLTLDQDTEVCADYVERVCAHAALADSLGIERYLLAAEQIDGQVAPFWFAHRGLTLAFEPLQSGSVFPASLLSELGVFDEGLFIDCVETEFYLRARAAGAHALVAPGATMTHSLGQPVEWTPPRPVRWIVRRTFRFREDAAFRNYYIMRNRITLYRRYARREPLWATVSVAKEWFGRIQATLFGSHRRARIFYTASGFRDARRGVTGRIPESTRERAARW